MRAPIAALLERHLPALETYVRLLAGFNHRQIAECMGRTEESCRQGLRRALVRIARHLEPNDEAD